jgi:DNA polymerase-3 subunit alpha
MTTVNKNFVHLHLHTDFSLLDAANPIKPLSSRVAELNMPACAITDHGNMYGAITFFNAMKAQGVKPIIGCEVYYTRGDRRDRTAPALRSGEKVNHHMVLLAKNYEGYQNLVRLTSKAFTEGFYYKPRIDAELLSAHSKGLIGISACLSGVPSALLLRGRMTKPHVKRYVFRDFRQRQLFYRNSRPWLGCTAKNSHTFDRTLKTHRHTLDCH